VNVHDLRTLAELLPPGGAVSLPREALLEALAEIPAPAPVPVGDLTVADVAVHFQRSPSTVRGWLEAGRFDDAYKLNGRDWRVPHAALAAFAEAQQRGKANLGAWRKLKRV
jgi:hypothetical protein